MRRVRRECGSGGRRREEDIRLNQFDERLRERNAATGLRVRRWCEQTEKEAEWCQGTVQSHRDLRLSKGWGRVRFYPTLAMPHDARADPASYRARSRAATLSPVARRASRRAVSTGRVEPRAR